MLVDLSMYFTSASLGYMAAKSRLGQRKSQEPSDGSKLHLLSPGFFGLLRNLWSAARTVPDLEELFAKLRCSPRFGNDGLGRQMVL